MTFLLLENVIHDQNALNQNNRGITQSVLTHLLTDPVEQEDF
tara:strand:- start:106 stop:231 length:126 start_codon:yes stop_codon:yes gene_type:complete